LQNLFCGALYSQSKCKQCAAPLWTARCDTPEDYSQTLEQTSPEIIVSTYFFLTLMTKSVL